MKRISLVIINILTGIILAYSQSGVWSGDLVVQGIKIPLVFHLDDENPTVDSPSQGVKGLPIQISKEAPVGITITIPAIGATFSGVNAGDKIMGKYSQSGMTFPLTLIPGEKIVVRPQTPKPPYPYSQEEVSFANGDAVLKGTLTLPDGYSKDTPVVIMVTGSGLQNRDEEMFDH